MSKKEIKEWKKRLGAEIYQEAYEKQKAIIMKKQRKKKIEQIQAKAREDVLMSMMPLQQKVGMKVQKVRKTVRKAQPYIQKAQAYSQNLQDQFDVTKQFKGKKPPKGGLIYW